MPVHGIIRNVAFTGPIVAVKVGRWYHLYREKKSGGGFSKIASDLTKDAAEAAADAVIENLDEWGGDIASALSDFVATLPSSEELGEIVGAAVAAGLAASSSFTGAAIREIGPAVVDSIEAFYDAAAEKLSGNQSSVIAAFTVGVLVILTGVFLYHEVSRGPKELM